ncbi:SHOCT domain-containing protein, partial [Candidatus Saccharibacteria bacterium]|nr:SHOCT domain-containing protein [Candidatus Saccharibacteria bacterium]
MERKPKAASVSGEGSEKFNIPPMEDMEATKKTEELTHYEGDYLRRPGESDADWEGRIREQAGKDYGEDVNVDQIVDQHKKAEKAEFEATEMRESRERIAKIRSDSEKKAAELKSQLDREEISQDEYDNKRNELDVYTQGKIEVASTPKARIEAIRSNQEEESKKLKEQFDKGTITQAEYDTELARLESDAQHRIGTIERVREGKREKFNSKRYANEDHGSFYDEANTFASEEDKKAYERWQKKQDALASGKKDNAVSASEETVLNNLERHYRHKHGIGENDIAHEGEVKEGDRVMDGDEYERQVERVKQRAKIEDFFREQSDKVAPESGSDIVANEKDNDVVKNDSEITDNKNIENGDDSSEISGDNNVAKDLEDSSKNESDSSDEVTGVEDNHEAEKRDEEAIRKEVEAKARAWKESQATKEASDDSAKKDGKDEKESDSASKEKSDENKEKKEDGKETFRFRLKRVLGSIQDYAKSIYSNEDSEDKELLKTLGEDYADLKEQSKKKGSMVEIYKGMLLGRLTRIADALQFSIYNIYESMKEMDPKSNEFDEGNKKFSSLLDEKDEIDAVIEEKNRQEAEKARKREIEAIADDAVKRTKEREDSESLDEKELEAERETNPELDVELDRIDDLRDMLQEAYMDGGMSPAALKKLRDRAMKVAREFQRKYRGELAEDGNGDTMVPVWLYPAIADIENISERIDNG